MFQVEQNWFALTGRQDYAVKLRRLMEQATEGELKTLLDLQQILLQRERECLLKTRELQALQSDSKKLNRDRKHLQEQVKHLTNKLRSV